MTSVFPAVAQLPPGLTSRPASPDDLEAVFALMTACDVHVLGEPDYDISELRDDWRTAKFDDETRAVVDETGAIVGYAAGADNTFVRVGGSVYVHPSAEGRGIGTALTRWIEDRARTKLDRAPDGAQVMLEFGTSADFAPAVELLANEGFDVTRYFLRMTIDLTAAAPVAPAWPDGIAVRTWIPEQDDRAVFEAVDESFSDHWGHVDEPYEEWRKRAIERENFDPAMKFLAMSGDQIAGVALCRDFPEMDQAWVDTVGVRRPWRRTGVALALLHHAFSEFRRRSRGTAALGVDAQSLTGATRVYEKAGMHIKHRFALFAKELRPGIDMTTQALHD